MGQSGSVVTFSSKVSGEEKKLIVKAMNLWGDDWSVRGMVSSNRIGQAGEKQLNELVTSSLTAALMSHGLDILSDP